MAIEASIEDMHEKLGSIETKVNVIKVDLTVSRASHTMVTYIDIPNSAKRLSMQPTVSRDLVLHLFPN